MSGTDQRDLQNGKGVSLPPVEQAKLSSSKTRESDFDKNNTTRKKRERHDERQKESPSDDRRHRRPGGQSSVGSLQAFALQSAMQDPVSHPLEEAALNVTADTNQSRGPPNGILLGDPESGFVLKPLRHRGSSSHDVSASNREGGSQSMLQAEPQQPSQKIKRPHSESVTVIPSKPVKVVQPKHVQVPHSRLSFGEELDEEEAQPSSSFSLAQSTENRFNNERELRIPSGNSMASPFFTFGAEAALANGSRQKTLGPIIFGVAQARGPRPYMEDRYTVISSYMPLSFTSQPLPDDITRSFAAVYDGHNGTKAAEHACARLHKVLAQEPALRTCTGDVGSAATPWGRQDVTSREAQEAADMGTAVRHAFSIVDDEILERARAEQGRDGATALIVLRIGEVIWAAHAGDSRAVLCRGGTAVRLTQDHKPEISVEKARVEAAGGKVDLQRCCWRVICPARNGRPASGLAVSRSFGDLDFKEPFRFIECEPDVTRLRATDKDSFVVMASDGLWDVISDQEAVELTQESLARSQARGESKAALDARAKAAAEDLLATATQKGSMDNITVLILLLQWH